VEEQLIKILQEHPGEPFSHSELLKLTKTKSRPQLKKILKKMIKDNPDNFGSKTVSRIAVIWARESKGALPTVSDESDELQKRITQLEKEKEQLKELEKENQKLKDELKKKESKKEEKGSKPADEIKDKLLEDLIDTLTEEFPHALTTRSQLKQFFKEVIPVVLKRYF
jgi:predicted nuclease with TOPRIM domain